MAERSGTEWGVGSGRGVTPAKGTQGNEILS